MFHGQEYDSESEGLQYDPWVASVELYQSFGYCKLRLYGRWSRLPQSEKVRRERLDTHVELVSRAVQRRGPSQRRVTQCRMSVVGSGMTAGAKRFHASDAG